MNKVEKTKKLKTGLKFYKNSFALHPPYLILCDGNFIYASVDTNVNLNECFKEVFRGQTFIKVSECSLHELDGMKGPQFGATKSYAHTKCQKFKCGHPPKKPNQCILQALRQGFPGSVATQDPDLRRKIHRDFPKTPVFFIARQTLQLSPPPKSLKEQIRQELIKKYAPKSLENAKAEPCKDDNDENAEDGEKGNDEDAQPNNNKSDDDENINEDNDVLSNANENDVMSKNKNKK